MVLFRISGRKKTSGNQLIPEGYLFIQTAYFRYIPAILVCYFFFNASD